MRIIILRVDDKIFKLMKADKERKKAKNWEEYVQELLFNKGNKKW